MPLVRACWLTDRARGATTRHLEFGTHATLSSGTSLNVVGAAQQDPVPDDFGATASGLAPSTTDDYRARAINNAGPVRGPGQSGLAPSPGQGNADADTGPLPDDVSACSPAAKDHSGPGSSRLPRCSGCPGRGSETWTVS